MFALVIQAAVMLAIIGSFVQSRRVTEGSVLHAAASSLIYGIIEQIKGLEYTQSLPSTENDVLPTDPTVILATPPFVRVRINQDRTVWLNVVYTTAAGTPKGPLVNPGPKVLAADVKYDAAGTISSPAVDNFLGSLPLSTVTGTKSQSLALNLWVWIDELAPTGDLTDVKKITVIYTYSYMDGMKEKVVRDREVFIRTRFDL